MSLGEESRSRDGSGTLHDAIPVTPGATKKTVDQMLVQTDRSPKEIPGNEDGLHEPYSQSAPLNDADKMQPLLEPWMVGDTPEETLTYAPGEPKFVKMPNGDSPMLLIEINEEYLKRMKKAAVAKRRLPELKEAVEKREAGLIKEKERCSEAYNDIFARLEGMKGYPPSDRQGTLDRRKHQAAGYRQRLLEEQTKIQKIDAQIQRGQQLYAQDFQDCWDAMWGLGTKHESMLLSAGVSLDRDAPCNFGGNDCKSANHTTPDVQSLSARPIQDNSLENVVAAADLHQHDHDQETHTAEKRNQGLIEQNSASFQKSSLALDINSHPSAAASSWGPRAIKSVTSTEPSMDQEDSNPIASCRQQVADRKCAFDLARYRHDEHREKHQQLFDRYGADHPDLQGPELADSFGAVYLGKWKELLKILKDADDDFVQAQQEEKAEIARQGNEEEEREDLEHIEAVRRNTICFILYTTVMRQVQVTAQRQLRLHCMEMSPWLMGTAYHRRITPPLSQMAMQEPTIRLRPPKSFVRTT